MKKEIEIRKYKFIPAIAIVMVAAAAFWFILPGPLFNDPHCTVVYDRNGELLGAHIAADEQWRFPEPDSIPCKFSESLRLFEDEYFFRHPGINIFSICRALYQDVKAWQIVSGGSTISMQVIRLSRKNRPRTIMEKLAEIVLTLRLELRYTKDEILKMYAANAPFGGNVVGLEAASWRYFGRDPSSLSWAESATLAVLPNAPSLIYPGRNRDNLLSKRNRLLKKIFERHLTDKMTYELSLTEPLPGSPRDLPDAAYHLAERLYTKKKGRHIYTTLDANIQENVYRIFEKNRGRLYSNQIHSAACLILDVETGKVLAYAGNIRNNEHPEYGGDVDVVTSPRSSGSILKPFLYCEMLDRGEILPKTLIADIPTRFKGYSPKNYNREYDGAVPASLALARSLNVPAVRMLYSYGNELFHHDLRELGFTTVNFAPEHYGLSLILGGAEVNLWELAGVYASMARVLNHYTQYSGRYFKQDWHMPLLEEPRTDATTAEPYGLLKGSVEGHPGAGAIWSVFQAMREVNRPYSESGWEWFSNSRAIAWKTGTSFGFRDGWAVGITPDYVVAVWTGNADGEGRPGLTGINTAAPLLFELFHILPETDWFDTPFDDLAKTGVCRQSGHLPGRYCQDIDSVLIPRSGLHSPPCPFHRMIHLDAEGKYRVTSSCYDPGRMIHKPWFILPPAQEWFFRKSHPDYRALPPVMKGCRSDDDIRQIEVLYPDPGSLIYIPLELDGSRGKVVFEAAHRQAGKALFWSIDDRFAGKTVNFHQIAVNPPGGKHILTLVDEDGNRGSVSFEILEK